MPDHRSSLLFLIPAIAFGVLALLLLTGCTGSGVVEEKIPSATRTELAATQSTGLRPASPRMESQESPIEKYIVQEVAGSEKQHRYIIEVKAQDARAPLPMEKDAIQKCWLYQDGVLNDCAADDFVNAFGQEGAGDRSYSYVIFSIVNMDPESGKATVRLDELAGSRAGKGLLYTLVQVDGQWKTESSKLLWSG